MFSYEGRLVDIVTKFGELVILSVAFMICCIPVVTIGPAATSLYYAVIKSVRRERGTPIKEFWASMKRTAAKGCLITILFLIWFGALFVGYGQLGQVVTGVYIVLIGLSLCLLVYIFPILSRFTMGISGMFKLAFVMAIRFFPVTVAVIAGTIAIGWLQIYVLPIPCILFVPGCWCYVLTFLIEKALLFYMPPPDGNEDAWYYGGDLGDKSKPANKNAKGFGGKEVGNEA